MRYLSVFLSLVLTTAGALLAEPHKLLVVSIDGLDHRYLADRDQLGLKIPNLRRLILEGTWADGMVGVVPTVTWPSHTTMITGVRPAQHGILSNRFPKAGGGSDYYWTTDFLRAPTLWHAVKGAGRTAAAITWPVTVVTKESPAIDWNLPEYFQGRNGGAMDLASIGEKSSSGLVDAISRDYPSFPMEWMDDRTRALATLHILKRHQPDLTLLHFVDHDAAAHHSGPFSKQALAAVEFNDELLGQLLAALPANTVVAVVSDHGFERVEREMNVAAYLAANRIKAQFDVQGGYLTTTDEGLKFFLRRSTGKSDAQGCIGREIGQVEIHRFLPGAAENTAVYEAGAGCFFVQGLADGEVFPAKLGEVGRHGHWPNRYRATFLLWGPGVKAERSPEIDMLSVAGKFAEILEIKWPVAQ